MDPLLCCVMLSMSSNSISGIPNRSAPFPEATKNIHDFCIFLCFVVTLHTPKLGYAYFNIHSKFDIFVFGFFPAVHSSLPYRIKFWRFLITLHCGPWLSILYSASASFCLLPVSNFVRISDLTLLKLRDMIITASTCLSSSCSTSFTDLLLGFALAYLPCLCVFLHRPIKLYIFLDPPHVLPYDRHCLHWCIEPQYSHFDAFCLAGVLFYQYGLPLGLCFTFLTASKSLLSFRLSSIAFCDLWVSSLLIHDSTCLLVTSLISFIAVSS